MSQPEPLMVAKDKQTLYNYLEKVKKSHPNMVYAEWGSGGSTYAALKYASYVISIENHKEWCDKMTNDKIIQCSIVVGKMQYICAVGGKTGTFGVPVDMENYHPEKYINALQTSGYEPDFVFIDGRFRVATALGTIFSFFLLSLTQIELIEYISFDGKEFASKNFYIWNDNNAELIKVISAR